MAGLKGGDKFTRLLMEVAGLGDDAFVARMTTGMPARMAPLAFAPRIAAFGILDVIGAGQRQRQVLSWLRGTP